MADEIFKREPARGFPVARQLGVDAVRISVVWHPGAAVPDLSETVANAAGVRVFVSVFGPKTEAPRTPAARADYCGFLAALASRHPQIRDLIVWNEPNLVWQPQGDAPEEYAALLARCWRELPADINVHAFALCPCLWPTQFVRRAGAALGGRQVFDSVVQHSYLARDAWPWTPTKEQARVNQGDLPRLAEALREAFGVVPPIYFGEAGIRPGSVSEAVHAEKVDAAIRYAACQPYVRGIFHFMLSDEPSPDGWKIGLLDANGVPKPAYEAFRLAAADVRAGRIDCPRYEQLESGASPVSAPAAAGSKGDPLIRVRWPKSRPLWPRLTTTQPVRYRARLARRGKVVASRRAPCRTACVVRLGRRNVRPGAYRITIRTTGRVLRSPVIRIRERRGD